jgi:hypothetical protein
MLNPARKLRIGPVLGAMLAIVAFAVSTLGTLAGSDKQAASGHDPHVFVPTVVEIKSTDAESAPTF